MKSNTVTVPLDSSSFGVSKCEHTLSNIEYCMICTVCAVCRNNGVSSRCYLGFQGGIKLFAHESCRECPVCETTRNFSLAQNGVEISCNCEQNCPTCNWPVFKERACFVRNRSKIECYHMVCLSTMHCSLCVRRESSIKNPFSCYNGVWKHDGCRPQFCFSCGMEVKSGVEPLTFHRNATYHTRCFAVQKCFKCGEFGQKSLETKDGKTFYHAPRVCIPLPCKECGKILGTSQGCEIGKDIYHKTCLRKLKCYLCEDNFQENSNLAWDEVGIRHTKCDPNPCSKCDNPLSNMGIEWYDKMWHTECIPPCYICNTNELPLRVLDNGKIKHDRCSSAICFLCSEILGSRLTITWKKQTYHRDCVQKCSCGDVRLDPLTFPTIPLNLNQDLKLSVRMKRVLLAFTLSNKKSKALSHDMVRVISTMVVNIDRETRTSVNKRYGTDFRYECTPNRCFKNDKCQTCYSLISPFKLDTVGCHKNSCSMLRYFERIIWEKVFRSPHEEDLYMSTKVRILHIVQEFKERQKYLTLEDLTVYSANMSNIVALKTDN